MNSLQIREVTFEDSDVCVTLANGRQLRQGLTAYPALHKATPEQRSQWTLIQNGLAVKWPGLWKDGIVIEVMPLVWDDICNEALGQLSAREWKLEAITQRQREIVALWRLEADGYNGGFMQFFCNWYEPTCEIAFEALCAIGAHATLEVVTRQRALLARLENSPDMIAMEDLPGLLSEAERHEMYKVLDHEFLDNANEIPALAVQHYLSADGKTLIDG